MFGCIGAIGGGFLSDSMAIRTGARGRIMILVISLVSVKNTPI